MGVCVSSKDNNPHLNNKSQKKNNSIVNNTNTIQQSHKEEIVKKEETVKKDTQLLRTAQLRAKNLIEERIAIFSEMDESEYMLEWTYEEN